MLDSQGSDNQGCTVHEKHGLYLQNVLLLVAFSRTFVTRLPTSLTCKASPLASAAMRTSF